MSCQNSNNMNRSDQDCGQKRPRSESSSSDEAEFRSNPRIVKRARNTALGPPVYQAGRIAYAVGSTRRPTRARARFEDESSSEDEGASCQQEPSNSNDSQDNSTSGSNSVGAIDPQLLQGGLSTSSTRLLAPQQSSDSNFAGPHIMSHQSQVPATALVIAQTAPVTAPTAPTFTVPANLRTTVPNIVLPGNLQIVFTLPKFLRAYAVPDPGLSGRGTWPTSSARTGGLYTPAVYIANGHEWLPLVDNGLPLTPTSVDHAMLSAYRQSFPFSDVQRVGGNIFLWKIMKTVFPAAGRGLRLARDNVRDFKQDRSGNHTVLDSQRHAVFRRKLVVDLKEMLLFFLDGQTKQALQDEITQHRRSDVLSQKRTRAQRAYKAAKEIAGPDQRPGAAPNAFAQTSRMTTNKASESSPVRALGESNPATVTTQVNVASKPSSWQDIQLPVFPQQASVSSRAPFQPSTIFVGEPGRMPNARSTTPGYATSSTPTDLPVRRLYRSPTIPRADRPSLAAFPPRGKRGLARQATLSLLPFFGSPISSSPSSRSANTTSDPFRIDESSPWQIFETNTTSVFDFNVFEDEPQVLDALINENEAKEEEEEASSHRLSNMDPRSLMTAEELAALYNEKSTSNTAGNDQGQPSDQHEPWMDWINWNAGED